MINTNKDIDFRRPIVRLPGETYKAYNVKNLGWLVRKSGQWLIEGIAVFEHNITHSAVLLVNFENGYTYTCDFASATVLRGWLAARRNMRGVDVRWYNGCSVPERYAL